MGDSPEPDSPSPSEPEGDTTAADSPPAADAGTAGEHRTVTEPCDRQTPSADRSDSSVDYNALASIDVQTLTIATDVPHWRTDVERSLAGLMNNYDADTPLERMAVHARLLGNLRYARSRSRYETVGAAVREAARATVEATRPQAELVEAFGSMEACQEIVGGIARQSDRRAVADGGTDEDWSAAALWGCRRT